MNEDFVTYEQAKKLKELGFEWEVMYFYDIKGELIPNNDNFYKAGVVSVKDLAENMNDLPTHVYSAPTLAQAQKWLREKEIEVAVFAEFDGELRTGQWVWLMRKFTTHLFDTVFSGDENLNYDTYEQACSAGIDKALELLKE